MLERTSVGHMEGKRYLPYYYLIERPVYDAVENVGENVSWAYGR
jgi:hypothetical protein